MFEDMSNNLLCQMYADMRYEKPDSIFETIDDVYLQYINGKSKLREIDLFKANEFPIYILENQLLQIGPCLRKTYFKAMDADFNLSSLAIRENLLKSDLVKQIFIDKISFAKIFKQTEKTIKTIGEIKIESTEEGMYYDVVANKEYALMLKAINDSSDFSKKKYFKKKPEMINFYIPEIILNMIILSKPIKLLFLGKTDSKNIAEFDIGIVNKKLVINKQVQENINLENIFRQISMLGAAFKNNYIPPGYIEKTLSKDEIELMFNNKIINSIDYNKMLYQHEKYVNFYCKDCEFGHICQGQSRDWIKREKI